MGRGYKKSEYERTQIAQCSTYIYDKLVCNELLVSQTNSQPRALVFSVKM